eukprot:6191676-Pleurochrysis_carterae.AAC.2
MQCDGAKGHSRLIGLPRASTLVETVTPNPHILSYEPQGRNLRPPQHPLRWRLADMQERAGDATTVLQSVE